MTDDEFVEAFESLTLDPVVFDHRGHLRLAFICGGGSTLSVHSHRNQIRNACSPQVE